MKLKITNKRKFKRTILIIIFGMLLILFFALNNAYSNGEIKYKQEYIYSGDTLWTIAEDEAKNNKYYENKDIRNIIDFFTVSTTYYVPNCLPFFVFANYNKLSYFATIQQVEGTEQLSLFL